MIKFVEKEDMHFSDFIVRHLDDMFAFSCGMTGTMLAINTDSPFIMWLATPAGQIAKFVIVSIGGGFLGMAGKKLLEIFLTFCEIVWLYGKEKIKEKIRKW